jgi:rhamnosyltransferase
MLPLARSIIIIDFMLSLVFISLLRLSKRIILESGKNAKYKNTLIIGANNGLNAKIKRLKLVFSSWYRDETKKIIKVLNLEDKYRFSKYILEKSYLNNILLMRYVFDFRRKTKDKIFLTLLVLLGIY